jgi:hypothetical protein
MVSTYSFQLSPKKYEPTGIAPAHLSDSRSKVPESFSNYLRNVPELSFIIDGCPIFTVKEAYHQDNHKVIVGRRRRFWLLIDKRWLSRYPEWKETMLQNEEAGYHSDGGANFVECPIVCLWTFHSMLEDDCKDGETRHILITKEITSEIEKKFSKSHEFVEVRLCRC